MLGAKAERVARWKHRPRPQGLNRRMVRHVPSSRLSCWVLASSRRTVISCASDLSINFSLIHKNSFSPPPPLAISVTPSIFPVLYTYYIMHVIYIYYIRRDPIDRWSHSFGPDKTNRTMQLYDLHTLFSSQLDHVPKE